MVVPSENRFLGVFIPSKSNNCAVTQEIKEGRWSQTECSNRYGEFKKRHMSRGQNGREHLVVFSVATLVGAKPQRGSYDYRAIRGISRYQRAGIFSLNRATKWLRIELSAESRPPI